MRPTVHCSSVLRLFSAKIRRNGAIASVCVLLLALFASCAKPARDEAPPPEGPRTVKIARAAVRPLERTVTVTGSLAAQEQATLSVKVPGRLESIAVDIGSVVERGGVVAQVERRDYELRVRQAAAAVAEARAAVGLPLEGDEESVSLEGVAAVKQARAVLSEAERNRERVRRLSMDGISSQSELDTVETAYIVAFNRYQAALEEGRIKLALLAQRRAELDVAQQQLSDTTVRAPFDGAVQARVANTGEYLAAGTPVASVVRSDPLRLRLEVPERESVLVQTGQLVRVTVDGSTNRYAGRITRISPAIAEQNRMLLVEADVPREGVLRPGLFARAAIVVDEQDSGLLIPAGALVTFAGIEKIVTVEQGKARERRVTTGRRVNGWVEITHGLKPGDAVILEPGNLRTGQPVNVSEEEPRPMVTTVDHSGP